ncbi:low-affinity gluconate transporter [Escherichia coli]|uniref:Low-affinity gluconate transporter n=1 Tax=Escherichia coli TaxID=562 RepID=A0A2X3JMB2_ECOLX|nr:low-affinity gluconate transporter [Escherichia coli]
MTTLTLVLTAVGSVLLLLFLVMKARMHAFLALMVVSMGAGLFSGMPLDKIAATMEKGMGGTLGFLAVVVALGAMFGKILHETGAVDQIAVKMLKSFGHSRAHYAIGLAGLVCALPLFFEVAIVLLISVAFSMARHTGTKPGEAGNPIIRRRGGSGGVPGARASANAAGIADERRFWLDDPDWPVCGNSGNDYCRAAVG